MKGWPQIRGLMLSESGGWVVAPLPRQLAYGTWQSHAESAKAFRDALRSWRGREHGSMDAVWWCGAGWLAHAALRVVGAGGKWGLREGLTGRQQACREQRSIRADPKWRRRAAKGGGDRLGLGEEYSRESGTSLARRRPAEDGDRAMPPPQLGFEDVCDAWVLWDVERGGRLA